MENEVIEAIIHETKSMLKQGVAYHKILFHLATAAEQVTGADTVPSILLLDNEGLLRNGASPKLPYDYLTAIDGLRPNPKLGTCAAAAATGEVVITESFMADDKWAELRHLPMALGFVGACSVPIKTPSGSVLGTFGIYYRKKHYPAPNEIESIGRLADVAAAVMSAKC